MECYFGHLKVSYWSSHNNLFPAPIFKNLAALHTLQKLDKLSALFCLLAVFCQCNRGAPVNPELNWQIDNLRNVLEIIIPGFISNPGIIAAIFFPGFNP